MQQDVLYTYVMQRNKYDIFISYSRKDLALVRQIKREIDSSTNSHCWMDLNGSDGGIESGNSVFAKAIVDAIENCKVFLFMLSKNSQESFNALRELNYAYDEKDALGIHVVIINIDNCQITNKVFKLLFGPADIISWTDSPQHDKLIGDLSAWVKSESEYMTKIRSEMAKKAKEFLYNKKERKTFYLFSGVGYDGFDNDYEAAYYFSYTQAEIDHYIQLFIDLYNKDAEGEDDQAKTLDEVVDGINLSEFEGENPEIDKLLERCRDESFDLCYIDSNPRYLYTMSYFYWDSRNNSISKRYKFKVDLTDEEYLYLLIEQLIHRRSFNYNILIKDNPQLALKIGNNIDWTDGYSNIYEPESFLVVFDEILADAEIIEGPLDQRIELFFDNSNQKWYRAIARIEGRQLILEEEKESYNRQVYLDEIDADKVMNCLSAGDYSNMLIKLRERYHDSDALSSIKSWLDFHEISYIKN